MTLSSASKFLCRRIEFLWHLQHDFTLPIPKMIGACIIGATIADSVLLSQFHGTLRGSSSLVWSMRLDSNGHFACGSLMTFGPPAQTNLVQESLFHSVLIVPRATMNTGLILRITSDDSIPTQ